MHFFSTSQIAITAAILSTQANAAVLHLFSDKNCQTAAGQRNVWSNSCAPTGGFESYIVTSLDPEYVYALTTFSRNACAGPSTSCQKTGGVLGVCYMAWNGDGGSNAVSSGYDCGEV